MRRILSIAIGLVALAMQPGCQNDISPAPSPARVPGPAEKRISGDWETQKPLPPPDSGNLPPPPFDDVALVNQEAPEQARFVEAYNRVGHPRILVWISRPVGRYEEAETRSIDYAAMENILMDWLSANEQVALIAPSAAQQALSAEQAQDLNSGRVANADQVIDRLKADVLVLVQAQPTRQSDTGPTVRVVAEASNLKGGESLGRAVVDVPAPLDKRQINTYTRFVARKLMDGMIGSWNAFGGAPSGAQLPAAPGRPAAVPSQPAPASTQPGTNLNPY